jgi:YggT family protein
LQPIAALHGTIGSLICGVMQLYVIALIARAIMSWFPVSPGSGLVPVMRALDTIIDPLLLPLRRIIPPAGMFDLSFLVLLILVEVVHSAVCAGGILI